MLIQNGVQSRVIQESTTAAGSTSVDGSIQSDSLIATLWVDSITSGTLSVSIYTLTDNGKELLLFSFPDITSVSTNLLLRKAGVSMQRFKVVATYTGTCSYEVHVRAVDGAGESSVKILGSTALVTDTLTVTTTPAILIPAALQDRNGLSLLNYSGGGTLFVSEDITKLPARAWPIQPGGGWSLDIQAGVTIYAVSSSGTLEIRSAESGG
jgi:hypothetical protein